MDNTTWAPPEEDFSNSSTQTTTPQENNSWAPPEEDFSNSSGKPSFASNAINDLGDVATSLVKTPYEIATHPINSIKAMAPTAFTDLPGTLAKTATDVLQHGAISPEVGEDAAKGVISPPLVDEAKRIGVGQLLTGHPEEAAKQFDNAFYNKPVTTALDALPLLPETEETNITDKTGPLSEKLNNFGNEQVAKSVSPTASDIDLMKGKFGQDDYAKIFKQEIANVAQNQNLKLDSTIPSNNINELLNGVKEEMKNSYSDIGGTENKIDNFLHGINGKFEMTHFGDDFPKIIEDKYKLTPTTNSTAFPLAQKIAAEINKMGEDFSLKNTHDLMTEYSKKVGDFSKENKTVKAAVYEEARSYLRQKLENTINFLSEKNSDPSFHGLTEDWEAGMSKYSKLRTMQDILDTSLNKKLAAAEQGGGFSKYHNPLAAAAFFGTYPFLGFIGSTGAAMGAAQIAPQLTWGSLAGGAAKVGANALKNPILNQVPSALTNIAKGTQLANLENKKKDSGYSQGGTIPDDVKNYVKKYADGGRIQDEPGIQDATVSDFIAPAVGAMGASEVIPALEDLGENGILRLGGDIVSSPEEIESKLNSAATDMSPGDKIQAGAGKLIYNGKQPGITIGDQSIPDRHLFTSEGVPGLQEGSTFTPNTIAKALGDTNTTPMDNLVKQDINPLTGKINLPESTTPVNKPLTMKDFLSGR